MFRIHTPHMNENWISYYIWGEEEVTPLLLIRKIMFILILFCWCKIKLIK
jgi:hypothetical protein